jgi:hypothetical protein
MMIESNRVSDDVFVQNTHANGIKVAVKCYENGTGHIWEKLFTRQTFDQNGREVTTGYTRLTAKEYELCRRDKLFQYFQGIGKLHVYEDLPASAMTPHEALINARKQIRSLQEDYALLQEANLKLTHELALLKGQTGTVRELASFKGQTGATHELALLKGQKETETEAEKPPKRGKGGKRQEQAETPEDEAQIEMAF